MGEKREGRLCFICRREPDSGALQAQQAPGWSPSRTGVPSAAEGPIGGRRWGDAGRRERRPFRPRGSD